MNIKQRAEYIQRELNRLYPAPPIPLKHKNAYTLLLAVLLSAQCTDKRVNSVTPKLFALADNPAKMSTQQISKIQKIIRPCGLFQRKASAIKQLSQILVEKFGGKVPQTLAELEQLPGVGHKTASVILIQAFGKPAFPVDTHIHRLARRWKLSEGKNVRQTEEDLKIIFPKLSWAKLHLQIIYYGREFCTARSCNGKICPICQNIN